MFKKMYIKIGEDSDVVVIAKFPMETKEPVVMLLKTWTDCAFGESLLDLLKVARKFGFMLLPLAT